MKATKVYYRIHSDEDIKNTKISMFEIKGLVFTPNVTHVRVAMVSPDMSNDAIFEYFNMGEGINQAFADKVRKTPNLRHTSMSVGDVIVQADDRVFVCADCGWNELTNVSPDFREIWK